MGTVLIALRSYFLRDIVRILLTDSGFSVPIATIHLETALVEAKSLTGPGVDFAIIDAAFREAGSNALEECGRNLPGARIVIFSEEPEIEDFTSEEIAMVDGILTWGLSSAALVQSLRLIQSGERVVPCEVMERILSQSARRLPSTSEDDVCVDGRGRGHPLLSPRETEILKFLVSGQSNKMIARELGITEATVKVHLKGILRKIGVGNRTQAAIWALNKGYAADAPGGSILALAQCA